MRFKRYSIGAGQPVLTDDEVESLLSAIADDDLMERAIEADQPSVRTGVCGRECQRCFTDVYADPCALDDHRKRNRP